MKDKLKSLGMVMIYVCALVALAALIVFFIKGVAWASEAIVPTMRIVGALVLLLLIFVLLPLCIFKRTRGYAAIGMLVASFVFGLICWLYGLLITYIFWGVWGVVLGFFLFAVGVVPVGMLAAMVNGDWTAFGYLLKLAALTWGIRLLAMYMMEKAE